MMRAASEIVNAYADAARKISGVKIELASSGLVAAYTASMDLSDTVRLHKHDLSFEFSDDPAGFTNAVRDVVEPWAERVFRAANAADAAWRSIMDEAS